MIRSPSPRVSPPRRQAVRLGAALAAASAVALAMLAGTARASAPPAGPTLGAELVRSLEAWTRDQAEAGSAVDGAFGPVRVEVELGRLDPRLKLAPCARIEPYLPAGSRPWGRTRVGLRCTDGATRWNVFLPVQVRVLAPAPVLREALPAGAEIGPEHLVDAEVDWAAQRQAPLTDPDRLIGRRLTRGLPAGEPLRAPDLQRPVWFDAGDTVKVVALGPGYEVSAQGQALGRGVDGQSVRVRTAGGRVVTGTAVAERRVELPL
jgi:flagella basal body P-ring formation protein FlgA